MILYYNVFIEYSITEGENLYNSVIVSYICKSVRENIFAPIGMLCNINWYNAIVPLDKMNGPYCYVRQCMLAFTFCTRAKIMKLFRENLLQFIYGALSLHNPTCLQVHHSLQHLGGITKRICSKESNQ